MSEIGRGWGFPARAKLAHYFNRDITSLCRKWMFSGKLEDNNHESVDNCADCKKRRAKLAKQEGHEETE